MTKGSKIVSWIFAVAVAVIFFQTLFFKFTGAEESVYIFTQVAGPEMESFGRIGSGIGELVAAVLILIPKTRVYGAVLSAIVILGAIFSHLTILGVVVLDDGGTLFILACIVLVLSAALVLIHRSDLPLKSSS